MDGTDEHANALTLLDELLATESGLTAWEMDFIESLDRQRGRTFSDKQRDILDGIGTKLGLAGE